LARALVTFAPGLVGFGLVAFLSRVHYARGDARTPALATAGGWAAVVAADLVLVLALPRGWTAAALGLGTTAGMTLAAAWMLVALARSTSGALRGVGTSTAVAGIAAVLAAGVGRLVGVALPTGGVLASTGSTVVVAAGATAVFAAVSMRLDPASTALLLRRVRRGG
jgi:putative peptidoglycan lipid II flippase